MGIRQRAFEPVRRNFCVWQRGRGKRLSGPPPGDIPAPLRCKFSVFALVLLNLHLIALLNDPNFHPVHMQQAGGEIHQYTFAPR